MLWVLHHWEGFHRVGMGYNGGNRGYQQASLVQRGFGRDMEPLHHVLVMGRGWQLLLSGWVCVTRCCGCVINGKGYMGLAWVTMVATEGINRLVWFNTALGGTGNHFLFFSLLFTLVVFLPCQECVAPRIGWQLALVCNRSVGGRPLEGQGNAMDHSDACTGGSPGPGP